MTIKKISNGQMPPPNQYVLIHVPDRPWHDPDDMYGVRWKVAKCVYGISKSEREKLSQSDSNAARQRAREIWPADEAFNNLKPYYFSGFGPGSYFGQEVDEWCELPGREEGTE